MKSNNVIIVVLVAIVMMFTGCKTSEQATKSSKNISPREKVTNYTTVVDTYKDWKSVVINGKVTFSMGKSLSSTMQLKMVRGESVSISVRPILGIEVMKVFIFSDSIIIIDKINKRYLDEEISKFIPGLPMDVTTIQDALLSRGFILGDGTFSLSKESELNIETLENGKWIVAPKNQSSLYKYSFDFSAQNLLQAINVELAKLSTPIEFKYSDYKNSEYGNISQNMYVEYPYKGKAYSLRLTHNADAIKWNSITEDKFEIGNGYQRMTIADLIAILKSI